ncbi:MAG: hypothetical protein GQ527_04720 [Bacteroidales bacterium]|nr:hypothetical protein [Bacteroidales bacterium]
MEKKSTNKTVPPPKGRLIWGGIILVSGFLSPLLIPWVLKLELSTGMKSMLTGLLVFGIPEIFMLIAIGILGKQGFQYLKSGIFKWFRKHGPPDSVSKTRYIIGLVLFSSSIIQGFVLPYIWKYLPIIEDNLIYILMSGDIILIVSLFILGGDFWDKLRSIYIYRSRAILIDNPQQNSQNHD